MKIFKHPYTVRRYGKTSWENGCPSAPYSDVTLNLDVQGVTRTAQDDTSGKNIAGSLTVYSNEELHPAEPDNMNSGDRLFFGGHWYVCRQSVYWGNTILKHWVSQFDAVEGEKGDDAENDD